MRRLTLLTLICLFMAPVLFAKEPVNCQARVTNRQFTVKVDPDQRLMKVSSDNGYLYEGNANYYYSPSGQFEAYYLQTGYTSGLEVQVELKGSHRIAFCRTNTECYLCQ